MEGESSPKQSDPKRAKMWTTSSDEGEKKQERIKRRKVAIFFAYCGVGYQGMQKNPGAKTIEGDLEEALYLSGGVPEHDRNAPRRYDFARSARTDKGVSAVGQVVSGRFYVDPPGFVQRLNSHLSPQIRVFGYKRVTGAFNAKKFCDRRRYVYLIPVFALDPSAHRDRESVLASLGSGETLSKCSECSDRGRKVEGLMGKRSYELRGMSFDHGDMFDEGKNNSKESDFVNFDEETKVPKERSDVGIEEEEKAHNDLEEEKEDPRETIFEEEEEKELKRSDFSYGESKRERFNRILKYYEGTHNFHNFTTRTKAEDPAAKRFIISFNANTVVTVEGVDFVKCEVVGQSFMLHQIRKMIGLAVAIMRNCAPESLIEKAFRKDVKVNVPTAPEVGLYLDECFFSSYNQKWKDSHEEMSMKAYQEEAETFKMKYIYPHIGSVENKEGIVALWLHSLNHRNYPDLQCTTVDNESATNKISAEGRETIVE